MASNLTAAADLAPLLPGLALIEFPDAIYLVCPWPAHVAVRGRCAVAVADCVWIGNACPIPGGLILESRQALDAFRLDECTVYQVFDWD